MRFLGMMLAGALLLAPALAKAEDDPFAGWTEKQLKVKIQQLQKENADLKAKLGSAPAAAAPAAKADKDLLLDNFEGAQASNGQTWWAGCDTSNLGTTLEPQPFAPEKGGAKASPGHSGRIHGHYGVHKDNNTWPWASAALPLVNQDIRGYSALKFWAKGDGSKIRVSLCRVAVKDFAYHAYEFTTTKDWTEVNIPLTSFAQPMWGQAQPAEFKDVEKIQFSPVEEGKDYDVSLDELTLVK